MKKFQLFLLVLTALACTLGVWAAVVQFGSTSVSEWAATSSSGCSAGSTVTLDGAVITFGSADDASTSWSWHAGNAGLLPSQMPSTDGTAATLVTTFSEEEPFGTLPTRGNFFKIEPTTEGTITISGKPSANAAQPLVFVTADKEAPTTILTAKVTPYDASESYWSYEVDADHVYYFFQLAYSGQLSGYRFTLRSLKFDKVAIVMPDSYYELQEEIEAATKLMGATSEAVVAAQAALDAEDGTAESYSAALATLKAAEQAYLDELASHELGEGFPIMAGAAASTIVYDAEKDHAVVGVAAEALAGDIFAVTGRKPETATSLAAGQYPIILGTIGQSALIDQLVSDGKVDVSAISGKWEAYTLQYVENAAEGITRALVIAGSTPRGTAYGAFELSRHIGVSPYVWWADVTPAHQDELYFTATDNTTVGEPSVRFRGLFINDEDWGIEPWAAAKMDTDIRNIGPRTYERVFELLLRLRANIMWPAMHACSKAFWSIEENPQLAAKYDIVLGSSHCEPMLRNNVGEWTASASSYNYATNASGVQAYWRTRVEESKNQDVMYTLGMRGVHDGAIQGYSGAANIAAGLKDIISFQRGLIEEIVNPDVTQVPQTFIPYKEVLDAYNAGLQVPEDVTLTWVDDNHGYIRQMPTEAEQQRSGSHGIYYHLSYYGSPQDYLWLSSIGPSQISYELTRGYQQGIQRLWIINVGDIKPAEAELEFCMDLAWDINAWGPENAAKWSRQWAAKTFGEDVADAIGNIKQEYYRLAAGGKPEHVAFVNYSNEEMNQRIADYKAIADQVESVKASIRPELQDAFFQLIEYPVRGAYLMNVKHLRAAQSLTEASAGRGETALQYAAEAKAAYDDIQTLTYKYNKKIAGGKWDGIMSAAPRGQAAFNMPSVATEADISPVESNLFEGTHITVSDYMSTSGTIRTIDGLGMQRQAVCVWPMDMTSYTNATDAPNVDYALPVKAGTNTITVRCLPTFPVHAGGTLRYAVQNLTTHGTPVISNIATTATSSTWNQNVLRGWATGTSLTYEAEADGELYIRVYLMDPGLAISEVTVDQPAETALTEQYMVNPDFELTAAGAVNTGGGTVRGVPYGWSTNQEFTGNSKGINGDGANKHGDNSCWFWNKPMPANFELYQTIENLPAGRYRLACRLGCKKDCLGTLRLFAGNTVQYFGSESNYAASALTAGEQNTFAAHTATSDYNTLQNMFVDFEVNGTESINVGIRTGNKKADGTTDTSGETGTFRVDYFQLFYVGEATAIEAVKDGIQPKRTTLYDLNGRPVPATPIQRGIYIQNGRKVLGK